MNSNNQQLRQMKNVLKNTEFHEIDKSVLGEMLQGQAKLWQITNQHT